MPRRYRHRTMKGGFWESLTQGVTSAWGKTKNAASGAYGSATGSSTPPPPPPASPPPATTTSGYMGGRKKSRRKRMRGGYSDNIYHTGLAASAAPISDIKSAQPQTMIGGRKTKRHCRYHKHGKSCKHRR